MHYIQGNESPKNNALIFKPKSTNKYITYTQKQKIKDMKQIRKFSFTRLIAALSGIALFMGSLAGCTRDDIAEGTLGNGVGGPMKFLVADTPALTKSDGTPIVEHLGSQFFDVVDGDSLYLNLEGTPWAVDMASTKVTPYKNKSELTGSSFGFAAYKQDADDSAVNTWLLHGGPIEAPYNGTYWEPTTTILWPNLGKKVHFFAYAPYDAALTMTAANGTEPTLSGFQVASGYAQQKDLLWANNVTADSNPLILNGGGAMEAYKLTFRHALAAIRFKVIESANITVNSVTVRGVYDGGTLNMNTGEWSSLTTGGISVSISNPTTTPDGNGYGVFDEQYTLMMIPNISGTANTYTAFPSGAEIEVRYTKAGVTKTITTDISKHQWRGGYALTYVIGDFAAQPNYDYIFNIEVQPTLDHTGRVSEDGKVVSYKQLKSTSTPNTNPKIPVGWIVEGYYNTLAGAQNADVNERISNGIAGAYIYSFTPESSSGSVDGEQLTIAHPGAIPTSVRIVDRGSARNNKIAATAKKERVGGKAYNLSNPADPYSDVVMNTANTYIINGAGYYRFPIVMGNGVKNGGLNTDAYSQPYFVDYKNNAITDPYLRGTATNHKKPMAALLSWEDKGVRSPKDKKIIEVVDRTASPEMRANANREGYYLNYPGANNGITKTTDANGDVYWVNFHIEQATEQGIAAIAVLDEDGKYMWSWLIWLTDYQPGVGDVEVEYMKKSGDPSAGIETLTFMKDVLGFVDNVYVRHESYPEAKLYVRLVQVEGSRSAVVNCVRPARGNYLIQNPHPKIGYAPFYQWGRVTPIIPSNGEFGNIGERTTDFTSGYHSILNTMNGPVGIAEQHFAGFILNATNWSNTLPTNLWNTAIPTNKIVTRDSEMDEKVEKSIYDPCPVGYTVPRRNAFTGLSVGVPSRDDGYGNIYGDISSSSFNLYWIMFTNYRETNAEAGTGELFLPIASRRVARTSATDNYNSFTAWTSERGIAVYLNQGQGISPVCSPMPSVGHFILPQKEE